MTGLAGAAIAAVLIGLLYEANEKIGAFVLVLVIIAMLSYAASSGKLTAGGTA